MNEKKYNLLIKIGVLACFILLFGSIQLLVPDFYQTLFHLTIQKDGHGLARYIASFGYWAIVMDILMIVIANMSGLPSIEFLLINGLFFGLVPGIIISWIGEVIGNEISFVIIRMIFRDKAQTVIEKHNLLEKIDSYSNFTTMLIARAIPYSPNVLITSLGALSRLSFYEHTMATLIGKLPSVTVEVWMGHDLLKFSRYGHRFLLIAGVMLVLYAVWRYYKYRKNKTDRTD